MTASLPLEQKITKMMPSKNVLQNRNFRAKMRAVMEVNPGNFLTNVHCPVLAIFGENDTSNPVDKSVFLYKQYLGEAGTKHSRLKFSSIQFTLSNSRKEP